jgi:glycosyltransferase involved in cell wall biosynthesis
MKIAFIYDSVYPYVTGGAEKRIYELATRLAERGHDVHWYGIGWWWPEKGQKDIEINGIKLHGVCKPIDLYNDDRRSIKEALQFAIKLYPKLMRENFDIIDCQGFPFFSCFTAKIHSILGKSNLIITLHEVWDDYWYDYLGKIGLFGKAVEKMMVYLSSNIITVSEKTKKDLKKIKPSENSVVIPNGISFNEINEIKPRNENSDVIFAGRLIKEKNVDILIKAINILTNKMPNLKCLIIGDGPEKKRLIKQVEELSLQNNIKFMEFMKNYNDLIGYFKSSKVFVLPSKREGFGIVVIEANACGLPVIVANYDMNAATDLVVNGVNGYIAEPLKEDVAQKIIKSLENKKDMKNKCIEISKEYDWNKIVDSLFKFYETVI